MKLKLLSAALCCLELPSLAADDAAVTFYTHLGSVEFEERWAQWSVESEAANPGVTLDIVI